MNAPCVGCGHPDAAVRSNGLTGVAYTECDVCSGAFVIPRRHATVVDLADHKLWRKAMMGGGISKPERRARGSARAHGLAWRYRKGCRCQPCRRAHTIAQAEYKERRRERANSKNTAHEAQEKAS